MSALNLLQLDSLTYNEQLGYRKKAEAVFKACGDIFTKAVEAFYYLLLALDYYTDAAKQLSLILPIAGPSSFSSSSSSTTEEHEDDDDDNDEDDDDEEEEQFMGFMTALRNVFCPNLVVACAPDAGVVGSTTEYQVGLVKDKVAFGGKPTAYLCEGTTCFPPTDSAAELREGLLRCASKYDL